jgi:flagellar motor switch protein FliG
MGAFTQTHSTLAPLLASVSELASTQSLLLADVLREALVLPHGLERSALVISLLDGTLAARVLSHFDAHEVHSLSAKLLQQRSVGVAQAHEALAWVLTSGAERIVPLASPASFLQQTLPVALGPDQGRQLITLLGLATPDSVTTVAQRVRLSEAEIEALLHPSQDPHAQG